MTSRLMTGRIMTVRGAISVAELGVTLPHEHVMVDFIGAEQASAVRYNADEVFKTVLPHLERARAAGVSTLVECTPAQLGRDVRLLRRLSEASGLNIVTNTGYYGAEDGKYLPAHARTETASELADRWTNEWSRGIDQTDIRPGLIKIGVNAGVPLKDIDRKLVRAAARTHLKTGLAIAAHCPDPAAAMEILAVLRRERVRPDALIWVHADSQAHAFEAFELGARAGAWIEFDGINDNSIDKHVSLLLEMKRRGLLGKVLLSHDAGWYHVGQRSGGTFRSYDTLAGKLLPALARQGFSLNEVRQMLEVNPRRALAIGVRAVESAPVNPG